jgi:hypothetical protein
VALEGSRGNGNEHNVDVGRDQSDARHKPIMLMARIKSKRREVMLYTIAVVMLVLWLLGLVTSYTMGGFIHILLVLAIIAILVQVIQGRRI